MAGQSNMVGSGFSSALPAALQLPQDDVKFSWYMGTDNVYTSDGFEDLRPLNAHLAGFGSEVTFGRALADSLTEDVAIVKVSYVGRGLERWWIPSRNELYPVLISHVTQAMEDLAGQGYEPDLEALVWVQSQADARWDVAAARYESNLDAMVGAFRAEFSEPDLPFIQSQHPIISNAPYGDEVRLAKAAFTDKDVDNHLVSIDDLKLRNDLIHFQSGTHIELGYRLADTYLTTVPEPGSLILMGLLGGLGLRRPR
ncbi:MAG: sialate O-acetylesterase [Planctomycetota bacterium]